MFSVKTFRAKFILPCNITIQKHSHIEKLDYSKMNCQSFVSTCDKFFVGKGIFSSLAMMLNYIHIVYFQKKNCYTEQFFFLE